VAAPSERLCAYQNKSSATVFRRLPERFGCRERGCARRILISRDIYLSGICLNRSRSFNRSRVLQVHAEQNVECIGAGRNNSGNTTTTTSNTSWGSLATMLTSSVTNRGVLFLYQLPTIPPLEALERGAGSNGLVMVCPPRKYLHLPDLLYLCGDVPLVTLYAAVVLELEGDGMPCATPTHMPRPSLISLCFLSSAASQQQLHR